MQQLGRCIGTDNAGPARLLPQPFRMHCRCAPQRRLRAASAQRTGSDFVTFPDSRQDRSCFPAVKHFRNP